MNVLKHGSKLVSVGLLSLSMSAGFSGLAFAQTGTPELFVTPNPTVLDNSSFASPAYDSFAVVVEGLNLVPGTTYVVNDNIACTGDQISGQTQTANNNGRVTFSANETGCVPGTYTINLRTPTALGSQVATTTLTVLPPQSGMPTPPVTTPPPTPAPTPTPTPFPGPFPGPFNGQITGQFNGTITPGTTGTTTPGQVTGLTPAQLAEANEHHPAAQTGFAGRPTGFAGRPTGQTSRRGGRASRSTSATSQNSDDALLIALLEAVAR